MLQDLTAILQQVLVTVGSAAVLVITAAASRHLSRLAKVVAKSPRVYRFMIDVGTARIAIVIRIGDTPQGRKSLTAAEGDGRDS